MSFFFHIFLCKLYWGNPWKTRQYPYPRLEGTGFVRVQILLPGPVPRVPYPWPLRVLNPWYSLVTAQNGLNNEFKLNTTNCVTWWWPMQKKSYKIRAGYQTQCIDTGTVLILYYIVSNPIKSQNFYNDISSFKSRLLQKRLKIDTIINLAEPKLIAHFNECLSALDSIKGKAPATQVSQKTSQKWSATNTNWPRTTFTFK